MKRLGFGILFLLLFSMTDCSEGYYGETPLGDTIPPFIRLLGNEVDTAYLFTSYKDPGAEVFDDMDGIRTCNDATLVVDVENSVNTRIPGTYLIQYHGFDTLGIPLTPVSRTVHVVENTSTYLNGKYEVACTCTVINPTSKESSITNGSYTVLVTSSPLKNALNISALEVGSEVVIPDVSLVGNKLYLGFWSPDLAFVSENDAGGWVSPDKQSFTIETTTHPFHPLLIYKCKNVFTRQITVK